MSETTNPRDTGWRRESWFTVVELEVNSRCNKRCSYCPVSKDPVPPVPRLMADATFERVLSELRRVGYAGLLSYHFFNEPLLRPDLERLVARAKELIPHAYQFLYTNGDLLDAARHASLLDAGIDHFMVTSHDGVPFTERPQQTVQYPADLVLSNRAGYLTHLGKPDRPLSSPCFAPSDNFIVTVTGDLVLCCDDFERTQLMGNINDRPIEEIWFSRRYRDVRRRLASGDRRFLRLCRSCTNDEFSAKGRNYQVEVIAASEATG